MKELFIKILLSLKFMKPLFKVILKKNEEKIIELINKKYDKKGMTEEEEAIAIKEIIDKLIDLI